MAEPWETIAPMRNLWHVPNGFRLPFRFDQCTTLQSLPDWLLAEVSDDSVDLLRGKILESLGDEAPYCLMVEYQADALGSPDPDWKGESPRPIQESAFERVRCAFLSLWLVRPTSVHFREVVHVVNHRSERVVRQILKYDSLCPLPTYVDDPYTVEEFDRSRLLFNALTHLSTNGTLRTAAQATMRALTEQGWTLRFLIFWLVLESLFGPEDAREITFRLSQRVALFLGESGATSRELFEKTKASYGWRSKVVHGFRLAKLTGEESQNLLVHLEAVVRQSFARILSDQTLVDTFDGKHREDYLDGLVFA